MTWSVEEWQAHLLGLAVPLEPEVVSVHVAHGRTLAADVTARHDLPLWDNSAMDGFAVRAATLRDASPEDPVTLRVVGEVPAGGSNDPVLGSGDAVRIMTGAPIPTSADTVVRFERVAQDGIREEPWGWTEIRLDQPVAEGSDIRRQGEDRRAGDVIARAGERLSANLAAALAASGCGTVAVRPRPRVAVIVTGSELRPPGVSLARGEIPESNSVLLAGLIAGADAVLVHSRHVSDDPESLVAALDEVAESCDAIVLTGGVGPGNHDVVRIVLENEPGVRAAEVRIRPGKPQCAGRLARVDAGADATARAAADAGSDLGTPAQTGPMVFGLSGNPVAAAVSFELFVRPCLLALQGRDRVHRPRLAAEVREGWSSRPGVAQVTPVVLDVDDAGGLVCDRAVRSGGVSHAVGAVGRANGFAFVPESRDRVEAGSRVDVLLVEWP